MAAITSGTVNATPLGDAWIGTVELAATADDGDTVNLSTLIGTKIAGVTFAKGVRHASDTTGVDISPISFSTGTATITIGNSGTSFSGTWGTEDIDDGRATLSNYTRHIFFVARSSTQ